MHNQENNMGQFKTYFFIAALLCIIQQPALAEQETSTITPATDDTSMVASTEVDTTSDDDIAFDDDATYITRGMLPELIIRPAWFVGTVFGAVIFIAGSPISGLASIPEPHDAFKITYEDFVEKPFNFTFRRPLGDW
jgi:hypothetical protein